jgi:hypothetical protein
MDISSPPPDSGRLARRHLALLRAVRAGQGEITASSEPNLFVDGLCCDQVATHELAALGLVAATRPARTGQRVPARLTEAGQVVLDRDDAERAVTHRFAAAS